MIELKSEIAGRVILVEVQIGDAVEAGQALLVLESMKMEIPVEAPAAGTVAELLVEPGDVVDEGQALARIREA